MTLRPILKAMPKYRRPQRSSPPSSCTSSSPITSPPLSASTSPVTGSLTPCSPSPSSRPSHLHLSPLPSPCLRPALLSPHVHFPPTPGLSSTELTHSPSTYDRAPIVVSPNSCELPERGGRVYNVASPDSVCHAPRSSSAPKDSYFYPKAFAACEAEELDDFHSGDLGGVSSPSDQFLQVPSLIPDLSSSGSSSCSESEDSDGLSPNPYIHPLSSPRYATFSPPNPPYLGNHHHSYTYPSYPSHPLSNPLAQEELAHALSFLPHSSRMGKEVDTSGSLLKRKPRKSHSRRTLRGDQTPRLSRRYSDMSNEWDSAKLDGCLGGF